MRLGKKSAVFMPDRIEKIPLSSVLPGAKNAKTHPPFQVEKIARSIKEFGFNIPVVVDRLGNLIAGHGRVLACHALGITEVPAIRLEHLTEAQVRAFRLADNRVAESPWDAEFLKEELADLMAENFDLSVTGFDEADVDALFAGGSAEASFPKARGPQERLDRKKPITCPECGHVWYSDR